MERFTERIDGYAHGAEGISKDRLTVAYCRGEFEATACVEKLAKYEDLEEQGLLLKLPINPKTRIYSIEYCCGKNTNNKVGMCHMGVCSDCENKSYYIKEVTAEASCKICELGKTVFLTQAEAEEALKGMEKTNDKDKMA